MDTFPIRLVATLFILRSSPAAAAAFVAERLQDSLPEWSKGVDSSSTSASCVGSNPTAVIPSLPRAGEVRPEFRFAAAASTGVADALRQFGRVV